MPKPTQEERDRARVFSRPRSEQLNPPTKPSANGEVTLHRFRVDAVIYAPTRKDAEDRLEQANIYLEAGSIVDA